MMIINDNSSVVNKWSSKLIDAARGLIYNRHTFIVQATEVSFSLIDRHLGKKMNIFFSTQYLFSGKWERPQAYKEEIFFCV
jgi:hypothetical protein